MDWIGSIAAIDWQPFLLAAVAILSLVNGFSVLQNNLKDRPEIKIAPVQDDSWVWWSELKDPGGNKEVRRYIMIGNMMRSNVGRRPTSIVSTELAIRMRNMKPATSPLYDVPAPVIPMSNAGTATLPVLRDTKDGFDPQPLLQPGEMVSGIHCFLFGMYGGELWSPKVENGIIHGTVEMVGTFGRSYKDKIDFRFLPFDQLEALFPDLQSFIIQSLEYEDG
ncbi:MAG: hypothetical protein AAF926_05915 [Pseudomonadota bacterium]